MLSQIRIFVKLHLVKIYRAFHKPRRHVYLRPYLIQGSYRPLTTLQTANRTYRRTRRSRRLLQAIRSPKTARADESNVFAYFGFLQRRMRKSAVAYANDGNGESYFPELFTPVESTRAYLFHSVFKNYRKKALCIPPNAPALSFLRLRVFCNAFRSTLLNANAFSPTYATSLPRTSSSICKLSPLAVNG